MILPALLLAVSLRATITIDRVGTCRDLIAEVARATNTRLTVDPELASGILLVRTKRSSPELLVSRIAKAVDAEWIEGSFERRLVRSAAIQRRIEEADERAIRDALPTVPRSKPVEEEARQILERFRGQREFDPLKIRGPVDDLLADLMLAIGPQRLSKLPPLRVALFSNRPTVAEKPFPSSASGAIDRYRLISQALARLAQEEDAKHWDAYAADRILSGAVRSAEPDRILLAVSRYVYGFYAVLTVYDKMGRRHSWASTRLNVPRPADLDVRGGDSPLGLAPAAASDPAVRDPHEMLAAPALRKLGGGGDVVVPLPDSATTVFLDESPDTEAAFVAGLVKVGVALHRDGEALVGTLSDPFWFARRCLSRPALTRWISRMRDTRYDPLRARGQLYFEAGDAVSSSTLDDDLLAHLEPPLPPPPLVSRWLSLAIGSLSDAQWNALAEGREIPMADGANRSDYAYGFSIESATALKSDRRELADVDRIGSVAFGKAVPLGTVLTTRPLDHAMLQAEAPGSPWMPMEALAGLVASQLKEETSAAIAAAVPGRYRFGREVGRMFRMRYGDELFREEESVGGTAVDPSAPIPYRDWPAEARQAFEQRVREARGGSSPRPRP